MYEFFEKNFLSFSKKQTLYVYEISPNEKQPPLLKQGSHVNIYK